MPQRSLLVGVDAGNTKTIALVASLDGRIVGTGRAGCGDIYGTTPSEAIQEINRAIDAALQQASAQRGDLAASGFSLAGADWPEDYELLRTNLSRDLSEGTPITIVNDALGALRAGTNGDGVAVVCGTGTAFGARRDAATWHASFWGEDAGALALGNRALRAVVRAELDLGPETGLTQRLTAVMGAESVEELLHRLTRRGAYHTTLPASLAAAVLDTAAAGDAVALGIVEVVGTLLGEYALVAATKVGLNGRPFTLVLAGGVFRHKSQLLRKMTSSALPSATPVDAAFEPATGALLLAFDSVEATPSLSILRETEPPLEFFGAPEVGA